MLATSSVIRGLASVRPSVCLSVPFLLTLIKRAASDQHDSPGEARDAASVHFRAMQWRTYWLLSIFADLLYDITAWRGYLYLSTFVSNLPKNFTWNISIMEYLIGNDKIVQSYCLLHCCCWCYWMFVAEHYCTAVSKLMIVKATFQRGSLLSCSVDGRSQSRCRWLDVSTDRVVSNSSRLDICHVSSSTSPRDLRCVVTVNVHGEEFDVTGNVSTDLTLWTIIRNSCDNSSTGRNFFVTTAINASELTT